MGAQITESVGAAMVRVQDVVPYSSAVVATGGTGGVLRLDLVGEGPVSGRSSADDAGIGVQREAIRERTADHRELISSGAASGDDCGAVRHALLSRGDGGADYREGRRRDGEGAGCRASVGDGAGGVL